MQRTRRRNHHDAMVRVSFSLPRTLVESLDAALIGNHESRSAAIRRLIEDALWEAKDRADDAAFVESYRRQPQTADFSDSPWE